MTNPKRRKTNDGKPNNSRTLLPQTTKNHEFRGLWMGSVVVFLSQGTIVSQSDSQSCETLRSYDMDVIMTFLDTRSFIWAVCVDRQTEKERARPMFREEKDKTNQGNNKTMVCFETLNHHHQRIISHPRKGGYNIFVGWPLFFLG